MNTDKYILQEVTTSAQEREWLDLPKKIYKGNRNWVCPLDTDIRKVFDPARNEQFAVYDMNFVKSDYKLVQVELKKILYIEGLKDYIKIYTEDTPKPILSLMSMKSMEELLPPTRFMRVHRSFIVQKDKIRIIDRGRIVFDKTYIPVSDSYKQAFQAFLDERS